MNSLSNPFLTTRVFFISKFNYDNGMWFKFIVTNHNSRHRVYICNGSPITRHSVICIEAMMDLIKRTDKREPNHDMFEYQIRALPLKHIDLAKEVVKHIVANARF